MLRRVKQRPRIEAWIDHSGRARPFDPLVLPRTLAAELDESVEQEDAERSIWRRVERCLSERSAEIVRLRAEGWTLHDAGAVFRITRERTRQIEAKALARLQRVFGADGIRARSLRRA